MLWLCVVPFGSSSDLRCDTLALVPLLAYLRFDIIGDSLLLLSLRKDSGPILCATIGTLPVKRRRIVHPEEVLNQLSIAGFLRIKGNEERLRVARISIADSSV